MAAFQPHRKYVDKTTWRLHVIGWLLTKIKTALGSPKYLAVCILSSGTFSP
jgi:hypothetical protein